MKLDTKELKMAYLMGWLHALASENSKEIHLDKQALVEELLEQLFEKKSK